MMQVIPSIDLMAGEVVRLRQGRRTDVTRFSADPVAVVRGWQQAGAKLIHVVDLDRAFGEPTVENERVLARMVESGVRLQLGGGLRNESDARGALEKGFARVVIGTAAVKEPAWVAVLCGEHAGRVAVAVDAKDDRVAVAGWTEASTQSPVELGRAARTWGACAVLYTDIERDGMEGGPNVNQTAALQSSLAPLPVIASGGVGTLEHLTALAQAGVAAAIIGRALHENRFTLAQALAVVSVQR